MASSAHTKFVLYLTLTGLLSFVFGIVAEHKKPPFGTPIQGTGVVVCSFPKDLSIGFAFLSILLAIKTSVLGASSVLSAKDIPRKALFGYRLFFIFYHLAIGVACSGVGMMLWTTVTEILHHLRKVHHNLEYTCPTAKTGMFGGAAFLHLDAMLLWVVISMIVSNVREDLHRTDEDESESQGNRVDDGYSM
ncbi:Beta-klotho [Rhynchospora pubera]|uniref:Beta-klotho n=2 Tax=Rhynchospora pubera TaxID=906938 RepID=A0AAV8HWH8_9POAL|nr:Beta-klotho [Rhynchospora pubera]